MDISPDTGLPDTFTYTEARRAGLSKRHLYQLRDQGAIEQIGHGLYHRTDAAWRADIGLVEIATRAPQATLCLTTALARHGLTDEIPARIDIALPRGHWQPKTGAPITWHSFHPATFDLGRDQLHLTPKLSIGIYDPPRCIIDAYRLRHREGPDLAITALKRWLRQPGNQPTTLLTLATHFPATETALRAALETVLA